MCQHAWPLLDLCVRMGFVLVHRRHTDVWVNRGLEVEALDVLF